MEMDEGQFDYIIAGGGTAGLAVASRLSEDPNVTVLVIEAGSDAHTDPRVTTPALWTSIWGSELDWDFVTTPQEHLNGRRINLNQGKALGGSSSLNAQLIIPPSASDLDAWEALGNTGWGWKTMADYVRRPFMLSKPDPGIEEHLKVAWAEELAQSRGPVKASFVGVRDDPLGKAWVETFENLGFPLERMPFSGKSTGPYNAASAVDPVTKTRSYSSTAYHLPAADRKNLYVVKSCHVTKIILDERDGPRAVGVECIYEDAAKKFRAHRETILCAGVFNSPKILELSGIGDPELLRSLGVEVRVANPSVGTNLQDHIFTSMSFQAAEGVTTADDLIRQDEAAIRTAGNLYHQQRSGPLCSSGITSVAYLPTVDFDNEQGVGERPALDYVGGQTHPLDQYRLRCIETLLRDGDEGTVQYFNFPGQFTIGSDARKDTTINAPGGLLPENYITIIAALSHPLSNGTSHISSTDPFAKPTIDQKYLSHPADLELQARHVRYLEKISATPPLATLLKSNGKRSHPTAFIGDDLEKAKEYVKLASVTNGHSCGTCAMAPKEKGGVVDDKLQVHGVKDLRVVDASVFPLIPQSNLMALVYAVAERAADIIKAEYI